MNFKIISRDGEVMACTTYAEDAAVLVANGTGTVVKYGGKVVWTEGAEEAQAFESYDEAARTMNCRAFGHVSNDGERWFTAGRAEG